MAERVLRQLVDDLDGSEAVETVRFGYAGRSYEIDLSEEHVAELDEFLAPYVEHGRRIDGGGERPRRGHSAEKGRERRSSETRTLETRAIRRWAREQGLQVIPEGAGRCQALIPGPDLSFRRAPPVFGRAEVGVGVKARPKADRAAAAGP